MKDKKSTVFFVFFILLINFLLLPIDYYLQNNNVFRLLNLKDKSSLILNNKDVFYNHKTFDKINILEFNISDDNIYKSLRFTSKDELEKYKNDKKLMLILSHLNLQSYLESNLPKKSIRFFLFPHKKLNEFDYCNNTISGWDFIIIDETKSKLILINYVKSQLIFLSYNFMPDYSSG